MTDEREIAHLSGHTHGRLHTTCVTELDGSPVTVSVDGDGTLWVCDLLDGTCDQRPLELAAAGPDDAWYAEVGAGDEDEDDDEDDDEEEEDDDEEEEDEDDEEESRYRCGTDPGYLAYRATVARLNGRPVLITGGGRFDLSAPDLETMGGAVRVWDLRTGRKIGRTLTGHGLGVTSLTTVTSEGALLAVSSSEEGELRAWDLTHGTRVAALRASYNGGMGAGLVSGRPFAVTGGHDDFVQVWDLMTGQQVGPELSGIDPVVRGLAVVEVDGRRLVVAGGDGQALHRWDLDRGEPLGEPLTGHTARISALAAARIAGRAVAVTGSRDGTSRVWDLAHGEPLGAPLPGELQAVTEIAGTPVAVTASGPKDLRLFDLCRTVG